MIITTKASVRPYMNKAVSVACVDLVPILIIEESSYILQSFGNSASYS